IEGAVERPEHYGLITAHGGSQYILPSDDRRPADLIRSKCPEQRTGGSPYIICQITFPAKLINEGESQSGQEMTVLRPARRLRVERSILGNLRRGKGNAVEIHKIAASQLQEEGFEFCDAQQGRIASRDSDWEIESNNSCPCFPSLFLSPIHDPPLIPTGRGRVRSEAVAF